jgi:transcriptional regulator with XRE-family HTH domain
MLYEKICETCREKGTNVSELERRCGLANATIRRWRTSSPSVDNLAKVADALEVSIDYLLGRVPESAPGGDVIQEN